MTFNLSVVLLTLVLLFGGCTKKEEGAAAPKVLNLYCWSNYFAPDVIKRFEDQTGAKVVMNYFSSNEELLAKLQAGARGYDLIVPTAYLVKALKELDLIQPLGKLDWPELKTLSPRFQGPAYDPKHEYTVPYAWGTTGIAVNRTKLKDKVDSWSWLFDHAELKGQLTMLDDAPSVIGAALKYLGYSYNDENPEALEKAKALLIKQKKLLKAYTPEAQMVLETGETAVSQAYSGDVLQIQKRKNPNIDYILPKEGGEIFIDNLAIPKGAPSPELAKEFIHFTLRQNVALNQAQHLFFSPVVQLSRSDAKTLPSVILPTEAQLKNFELMTDNPKRVETIQKIWTEIKSL